MRDALRNLAIRALLRLYPRAWRRRYGVEFAALLAQRPLSPLEVVDVVRAALDVRWVASRRVASRSAHTKSATALWERVAPATGPERWQSGRERAMARRPQRFCCSFCGKSQDLVRRLIAGPNGVYICDECVSLCNQIIAEEEHLPAYQQPEGARPAIRRRATPRWQRLVRRWLDWHSTGVQSPMGSQASRLMG